MSIKKLYLKAQLERSAISYILSLIPISSYVLLSVSTQLLPNLYHLGSAAREEVNSSSVGPIQEKLESMAGEVTNVMDQQLQVEL